MTKTPPETTRTAVENELLAWMREPSWRFDSERFERLALTLFAFQYAACPPYTRFCQSFDRSPKNVTRSEEIPAVPTGAFKEFELRCFEAADTIQTFATSGTSTERRGQLHLDTLELYEASLLASLRETFIPDLIGTRPQMRFLAPSPEEAPESSLTHMFESLRLAEGHEDSDYDLRAGALDLAGFAAAVERGQAAKQPMVIGGTSFAFVHFLDALAQEDPRDAATRWALPPGSRVLETGGFKGRSRAIPPLELRSAIAQAFGIPESHVLNQYGMTELGSQFYDSSLRFPGEARRKLTPPWTRVRFVDPVTSLDVDPGEVGLILIHDLANTGSIAALQTADLGRAILGEHGQMIGFEVLGREPGAETRGCSVAADAMLEAARHAERE